METMAQTSANIDIDIDLDSDHCFFFLCIFYNIKYPDAWWIYILDVLILIFSVYTIYTVVYLVKNFKEIANKHLKEESIKLKKSRSLKGN